MELSLPLERLSVDEPDDDAFANAPTGKFIANRHTTSTNPYDWAPLSGFEDKFYDTRKKALADLRHTSGLVLLFCCVQMDFVNCPSLQTRLVETSRTATSRGTSEPLLSPWGTSTARKSTTGLPILHFV
jgi:hypothetical protein